MMEVLLHISAGQGPRECEWVVAQLVHALCREGAAHGLSCEPVEPVAGPCPSAILRVAGEGAEAFAAARIGTIRWIGASPFRPLHKRRNWFVGIHRLPLPEDIPEFREEDIRYQTLRASGPGGQHVNTTDSAVRATHVPSGLAALSQDQRSQHANRKIARLKLAMQLAQRSVENAAGDKRASWERNHDLERGNAVRTYAGVKFKLA